MPVDVVDLAVNRQRYALFTNDAGGILDDLMITNAGDHLFVVVNAACKQQDIAHMRKHLSDDCEVETLEDRALLALQGPVAGEVMASLVPASRELVFMTGRASLWPALIVSSPARDTPEDGFEISVAASQAEAVTRELLSHEHVAPAGLGARDSLRLEAGLCLYGHDIDITTTPVEASLLWAIQKVRRSGGERAAGFPGADVILGQIANGVSRNALVSSHWVKFRYVRAGCELLDSFGNRWYCYQWRFWPHGGRLLPWVM